MSSLASWSYTSKATHWPLTGRDDRTRVATFGPGVVFDCDYKSAASLKRNASGGQLGGGAELRDAQVIYTERATIKPGDRVLIGSHAGAAPLAVGAWEVKAVNRVADTFEQLADDYEVLT